MVPILKREVIRIKVESEFKMSLSILLTQSPLGLQLEQIYKLSIKNR